MVFWNLDFGTALTQDTSGFTHSYLQATSVDSFSKADTVHFSIKLYLFFLPFSQFMIQQQL